jgi:hypothetical protein
MKIRFCVIYKGMCLATRVEAKRNLMVSLNNITYLSVFLWPMLITLPIPINPKYEKQKK